MQRGQRPPATGRKRELGETQLLLHEWDKLSLDEDGILRRCKGTRTQVIVPRQLRSRILKELHENMGQLGVERTLDLASIGPTCSEIMNTILNMSVNGLNKRPPRLSLEPH